MYKVLSRQNEELVSCVVRKVSGLQHWIITYIPYRWIKAKRGKILVCKTLAAAKRFYEIEGASEIWRCQTRRTVPITHLATLHNRFFRAFWEGGELADFERLPAPETTYGADTIKLTKRVYPK